MTLLPNTPLSAENVGLLKAGDVVMVVAPNHGEWTGGEWPVTKVGNVWADLKHPRFGEGMFFAQELVFVRPALSPPAEGLGHTDLMISPEAIDAFLATGDHPLITPTPAPVDWSVVGPKLASEFALLIDMFARDGECSMERFERLAEMFRKDTGYLAPGKDPGMCSSQPEGAELREIYDAWFAAKITRARAALAAAQPGAK